MNGIRTNNPALLRRELVSVLGNDETGTAAQTIADLAEQVWFQLGATVRVASETSLRADEDMTYEPGQPKTVEVGQLVAVLDGGDVYRVAASDATDHHFETKGGVKLNRMGASAIELKSILSAGAGVAEAVAVANRDALQALIHDLADLGGGIIDGGGAIFEIKGAVFFRSKVALINAKIRLTKDVNADGGGFLSEALVRGTFAHNHADMLVWHELDAITRGDPEVTLSNALDGSHYQAGDEVLIVEAITTYGDGVGGDDKVVPPNAVFAVLEEVNGGTLRPRAVVDMDDCAAGSGTIGVDPRGAWIANVSYRSHAAQSRATLSDNGSPIYCISDAHMIDVEIEIVTPRENGATAAYTARAGMIDCYHIRVHVRGDQNFGLYGNAHQGCKYICCSWPFVGRAIEIAQGTYGGLLVDGCTLHKVKNVFTNPEVRAVITVHERARGVTICNNVIDVGASHGSGQNCINLQNCSDVIVENNRLRGSATFAALVYGGPNCVRCTVRGNVIDCNSSVAINDEASDLIVTDNRFNGTHSSLGYRRLGNARGGSVKGNTFLNECGVQTRNTYLDTDGVTVLTVDLAEDRAFGFVGNHGITGFDITQPRAMIAEGNSSDRWGAFLAALPPLNDASGYSHTGDLDETVLGPTRIVPEGVMPSGACISWDITGECFDNSDPRILGGNGTKTIRFYAAVDDDEDGVLLDPDDDRNLIGQRVLPASCGAWHLQVQVIVEGASQLRTFFSLDDLTGSGGSLGGANPAFDADFATKPFVPHFSVQLTDSTDLFVVRTIRTSISRFGFRSI